MSTYRIVETPGRIQPFTVWRGAVLYHFDTTLDEAKAYVAYCARLEARRGA